MSLLSGLFANPGQGAANAANKRQGDVASGFGDLFHQALGQNKDWINLLGNLHLSGAFGNALNAINQGPEQRIQSVANQANEQAAQSSAQLANTLKSLGFGDGAIQGAAQGQYQNAQRQTNAFAQQQYSPEAQSQQLMALIQAITGGNAMFGGQLSQYANGVYGQPQVQVQQNPFAAILGQAAGAYGTGLASKAGKK